MKKKILTLALVLALLAIMVGGSLAYFTAEDEVTNTFTVGSVKIEIFENGEETKADKVTFQEPLVPVVKTDDVANDPGYIKKAVSVHNTGANDAYIRTHIAIPTKLVGYLYLDLDASGWTRQADSKATVDGIEYDVFTYDYNTALSSGTNTNNLLKGVYLASDVDLEEDVNGDLWFVKKTNGEITDRSEFKAHVKSGNGYTSETVSILVASQAIQAQGFENGATDALNTGFTTANPWAN